MRSCSPSVTHARSQTSPPTEAESCLHGCRSPSPWRSGVLAALGMIEDLDAQITAIDRELKASAPIILTCRC